MVLGKLLLPFIHFLMRDTSRKYLHQSAESPYPHMGKLLLQQIEAAHLNMSQTAQGLGVSPSVVLAYTRRPSLQAGILWNTGLVLKHNILADIAAAFPIKPAIDNSEKVMLETRIADLEKELAIYKSIVMAGK